MPTFVPKEDRSGILQHDLMDRIRRRAYEIWECEGRPAGRERIHWLRAEAEFRELILGRRSSTVSGANLRIKMVQSAQTGSLAPMADALRPQVSSSHLGDDKTASIS